MRRRLLTRRRSCHTGPTPPPARCRSWWPAKHPKAMIPGPPFPLPRGERAKLIGWPTKISSMPHFWPVPPKRKTILDRGSSLKRKRLSPTKRFSPKHRVPSPAGPIAPAVRQGAPSSVSMALLTGVVLAAVVSGIFLAGTLPVVIMLLVVLGLAAAEAYAAFRAVGAHPAAILGIVAVLTLGVAVYNKGQNAFGAITVLLLIFGLDRRSV